MNSTLCEVDDCPTPDLCRGIGCQAIYTRKAAEAEKAAGDPDITVGVEELPRFSVSADRRGTMLQTDWGEYVAYEHVQQLLEAQRASHEAEIARLQTQVEEWRGWAQFVYLGGGPVTLDDNALMKAVCQAHDAGTEELRSQLTGWERVRDALVARLETLNGELTEARSARLALLDVLGEAFSMIRCLRPDHDATCADACMDDDPANCSTLKWQGEVDAFLTKLAALLAAPHREQKHEEDTRVAPLKAGADGQDLSR